MVKQKEFFKVMKGFAFEAGSIAMAYWGKSGPSLKKDRSIVTLADKKISLLAQKKLRGYLGAKEHILIDEEDSDAGRYFNQGALEKAQYIWSVDPIDGTRNYANQIPSFGVSIGLFKHLKPWMGVVYFPALKEMFFHDGSGAYFVENAGTKTEHKKRIRPRHTAVDGTNYFLATDTFFKHFDWDHQDCRVMIQSCGAMEFCWPTVGRGCASLTKSNLWDFAGAWPVVEAAGMAMRSFTTGETLTRIDLNAFNPALPWRLRDFYIISDQENYSIVKNKITRKT